MQRLREGFAAKNVVSISGANELRRIQLGDKIGHVSAKSKAIVFDAFVTWEILGREAVLDRAPVVADSGLAVLPSVPEMSPVRFSFPAREVLIESCSVGEVMQVFAEPLI